MVALCKKVAESQWFSNFILIVILFAAVVVGLQTDREFDRDFGGMMRVIDGIILFIFTLEAVIKIIACGRRPDMYFRDGWNVFDFAIVVICFLPFQSSHFGAVLRLARVLRILKVVSAIPDLQVLVTTVLRSIPSIGYVSLLALLHFYIYGCLATFLYGENDPLHFQNLQTSMLSLFRAVTLEDWTDLMYINMYGSEFYGYDDSTYSLLAEQGIGRDDITSSASPLGAAFFFISFIVTGAMIVFNLFVGVIMTGMTEAKEAHVASQESDSAGANAVTLESEVAEIQARFKEFSQEMEGRMSALDQLVQKQDSSPGDGSGS